MAEKLATSVFTARDFRRYNDAVDIQHRLVAERMRDDLAWAKNGRTMGREAEYVLVDGSTGRLAHCASEVLEGLGDARMVSELGTWNLEHNAPVVSQTGTPFTQLGQAEAAMQARLLAYLGVHNPGITFGAFGVAPSITEADLADTSPEARFIALAQQLNAAHGPYEIAMEVSGCDTHTLKGEDVRPEATTTTCQLHRSVSSGEVVNRLNTRSWISSILVGLTGWGGHAFGKLLCRGDLRHHLFPGSIRYRGQRHDTDWYYHSMDPINRALAEPTLLPIVTGEPHADLRELRLRLGTDWPSSVRLIVTPDGLRTEGRDRAADPTIADRSASDALEMALEELCGPWMSRLIGKKGLKYQVAKDNLASAFNFGATAPIVWMDHRGRPHETTPARFVREHAGDLVEALCNADVDPAEANLHLEPAIARAERDFTPTDWLINAATKLNDDLDQVTLEAIARARTNTPVVYWSPL